MQRFRSKWRIETSFAYAKRVCLGNASANLFPQIRKFSYALTMQQEKLASLTQALIETIQFAVMENV